MELNSKKEFVDRTKTIVNQYNSSVLDKSKRYEVTLLLNACIGMLFVGWQFSKKKIPKMSLESVGLSSKKIVMCKNNQGNDEQINTYSICRHIRNSIAHARFDFLNTNNAIEAIRFIDASKKCGKTFEATMTYVELEKYLKWLYSIQNPIIP